MTTATSPNRPISVEEQISLWDLRRRTLNDAGDSNALRELEKEIRDYGNASTELHTPFHKNCPCSLVPAAVGDDVLGDSPRVGEGARKVVGRGEKEVPLFVRTSDGRYACIGDLAFPFEVTIHREGPGGGYAINVEANTAVRDAFRRARLR